MNIDTFLSFALPDIGEEEIAEVAHTLRSGWITTGPLTFQFEQEFRDFTGAATALAVNSCTAGLHLALTALDIGPGDEVITTPLTFCSTINVILQTGATPVLADIGPDLNIDPAAIRRVISHRTRAILPVHIAGLPCDMDAIWAIANDYGLKVVEDAAHAAGALYKGVPVGGGRSDAVAFSFYATKNMTTGEGGMVTSRHARLNEEMRTLCLHGISRDAWKRYSRDGTWQYEVVRCGFKYNMSDIMSAIGIHQLRKLTRMTNRRREIARAYDLAFADMPELELPPDRDDSVHCHHLYILRLRLDKLTIDRDKFFSMMKHLGVGCSVHFIPIPLHPYYQTLTDLGSDYMRAVAEFPRLLSLPLYSKMTGDDVSHVIDAVRQLVSTYRCRPALVAAASASGSMESARLVQ